MTKVVVILPLARCLKITEKVSFYIVSQVSYVYILSGQKLIKNAKNGQREGRNQKKEEKQVLLPGQRRQERNQNTNKVVTLEIYRLN